MSVRYQVIAKGKLSDEERSDLVDTVKCLMETFDPCKRREAFIFRYCGARVFMIPIRSTDQTSRENDGKAKSVLSNVACFQTVVTLREGNKKSTGSEEDSDGRAGSIR